MSPYVEAALISACAMLVSAAIGLTGVILTLRSQTRRIDADNRAALEAQTREFKEHLGRERHPGEDR